MICQGAALGHMEQYETILGPRIRCQNHLISGSRCSTLRHLRNVTWHVFSPSYHYLGLSKNGVPPNPVVSSLEPRLFTWPHLGFLVKSYRAQQKMSMPYGSPEISHSPGSPPLDPAGSLIFVQELAEKLVKIVEPRRDQLDACLCFPSMPEATRDCGWLEGLSPEKT